MRVGKRVATVLYLALFFAGIGVFTSCSTESSGTVNNVYRMAGCAGCTGITLKEHPGVLFIVKYRNYQVGEQVTFATESPSSDLKTVEINGNVFSDIRMVK
jgi:hypothetical protein